MFPFNFNMPRNIKGYLGQSSVLSFYTTVANFIWYDVFTLLVEVLTPILYFLAIVDQKWGRALENEASFLST